ncbi:MAG: hypothetical protein MUF29_02385 [Chitinophagaceae bacterium]|jgi:hypothetical protein|nr:hypothetical protein [Chitinophagaceae bacterium]
MNPIFQVPVSPFQSILAIRHFACPDALLADNNDAQSADWYAQKSSVTNLKQASVYDHKHKTARHRPVTLLL